MFTTPCLFSQNENIPICKLFRLQKNILITPGVHMPFQPPMCNITYSMGSQERRWCLHTLDLKLCILSVLIVLNSMIMIVESSHFLCNYFHWWILCKTIFLLLLSIVWLLGIMVNFGDNFGTKLRFCRYVTKLYF